MRTILIAVAWLALGFGATEVVADALNSARVDAPTVAAHQDDAE